jgi:thiol-disulfide isomerase/thioredoxin
MVLERPFALLLFISILIVSCEQKQLSGARVAVDFPDADSLAVKIYHYPILEEEILAQLDLDSPNYELMQLELAKPLMLDILINGSRYELYLKPGYDLKLSKDTTYSSESILFEGEGAPINNYINHISSVLFSESLVDYDINTFSKKYDSLNVVIENFSKSYLDRFPMQEDDLDLLRQIKKIKLLSVKTYYAYRTHEVVLMDQVFKFQKGEPIEKIEMPDYLQSIFSDIPFDTAYLRNGIFDYRSVLFDNLLRMHNSVIDAKLWDKANRRWPRQVSARWPRQVNTLIKGEPYPTEIKEHLIAKDLRHWMDSQGITPEIDSIFDEFKLEFEGSIYTTPLQKIYDECVALLPGNIAPDFTGRTIEGKLVSLKDFKGKVVYVDVWATWCGPCVEEIPYAKNLQEAFQEDKVIFLNVSLDSDRESWKKKLIKEKDWLGTHIILDQRERDNLSSNYKVTGIPKYLLIDQTGKIVSADASRPSSKTIREEITSLTLN